MLFSTCISVKRCTLVGAVSSMALLSMSPEAVADDELATIEALQEQIDALQQQLEEVREKVEKSEEAEAAMTATAEAAPAPRVPSSGTDDVSLTISGHVNRGLLLTDDGDETDVFFVDNDNSSTRIRLLGDARFNEDITVGSAIEVQFESNSTADVSQDNERGAGANNFTERKLEVFADSETYGRLWLGQGDTASNGTAEVDLSGIDLISYSAIQDFAGGIQFTDGDGNLTGVSIGDTFDNFDGLSRDDRLRYDTPSYHGAKLSTSAIAGDRWDLALRYSRELYGSNDFQAAIAFSDVQDDFDQVSGSASVLLGDYLPGVNMTIAAGTRDFNEGGRNSAAFVYGKLGYLFSRFNIGMTGVGVDYYYGEDISEDGEESNSVGVHVLQRIDRIGTEFYGGFRNYDLDRDGEDFDDINAFLTGARVKF